MHIYFDAATNQTNGDVGLGVWVKYSDGTIKEFKRSQSGLTSVQAEMSALMFALEQAHSMENEPTFMFYSDADTIVRAIEQRFIKNQTLKPLFIKALISYDELSIAFIKWIPRSENRADIVAKKALSNQ